MQIAIRSNLVDSFGSGVIVTGPGWLLRSPTYYAEQLYARSAGSYPLRLERGESLSWHLAEPDLSATISADGKILRIYGVNSTEGPLRVRLHLVDFPDAPSKITAYVLKDRESADDSEVMNSPDNRERVSIAARPVGASGREPELVFEPYSVTLLEIGF